MEIDNFKNKNIMYTGTVEIEKRKREVQLLINVVQPDPEYQPIFKSDKTSFYDLCGQDTDEIESNLEFYLKAKLGLPLTSPIWMIVDEIKKIYPEWPEEWPGLS